jgi:hypothetical protein
MKAPVVEAISRIFWTIVWLVIASILMPFFIIWAAWTVAKSLASSMDSTTKSMAEWQPTREDIEKLAYPLVRRGYVQKMLESGGEPLGCTFIEFWNQCKDQIVSDLLETLARNALE